MAETHAPGFTVTKLELEDITIRKYEGHGLDGGGFVSLHLDSAQIIFGNMSDWENFRQAVVDNEVVVS